MPVDIFLKIDDIPGDSTVEGHQDWMDIDAYSFGMSQSASTTHRGGGDADRVSFQELVFIKHLDKATPKLMLACATATHIREAVLAARKPGTERRVDLLIITLSDVIVSGVQQTSGADIPVDEVSFKFSQIRYVYKRQAPDGSFIEEVPFGWDLRRNTPL